MPDRRPGLALRGWLGLTWALQPVLPLILRRRQARGKEHPLRWREKLGDPGATRPQGRLIWLHAVGLGEVLALRGLIAHLAALEPDLNFLVTSGTYASARVFERNLPPRTVHQFAPLDAPGPARRFLSHWRPDLSIWAEQEIWPGLVYRANRAGVPLALVNARMNDAAFARREKGAALFSDVLARFAVVSAQDSGSAQHLSALGAPLVTIDGSLKPAAPPLVDLPQDRAALEPALMGRFTWLAASTHAEDEAHVLAAHAQLLKSDPSALLILSPRYPERASEILDRIQGLGMTASQRSTGALPEDRTQVYLADTLGEMGLFYRAVAAAFVGGSMGDVEGHNPWEAAHLGCAILHGPRTANFAQDYTALQGAGAAREVATPDLLAQALTGPDLPDLAAHGLSMTRAYADRLDLLCRKLLDLL